MKVLGILGSPRVGGNSDILLDQALAGAKEAGAAVEKVILAKKKISGCLDCGKCNKAGVCMIKDDMHETAYIVNPGKTVLLPEIESGCPMADMITVEKLIEKKKEIPGAIVVCYVNSSAAVKAESDICCTSANAVRVVQSLPSNRELIFVPDQYLGQWVAQKTGREMHLWPGYCPTHMRIFGEEILKEKKKHPGAPVLVHPECRPDAKEAADEVISTGGMIRYVRESSAKEFIIGTETGILHRLKNENPGKKFFPVTSKAVCPNMKKITLEKVLWALQDMQYVVTVPESIRIKALSSVEKMLAIG